MPGGDRILVEDGILGREETVHGDRILAEDGIPGGTGFHVGTGPRWGWDS